MFVLFCFALFFEGREGRKGRNLYLDTNKIYSVIYSPLFPISHHFLLDSVLFLLCVYFRRHFKEGLS